MGFFGDGVQCRPSGLNATQNFMPSSYFASYAILNRRLASGSSGSCTIAQVDQRFGTGKSTRLFFFEPLNSTRFSSGFTQCTPSLLVAYASAHFSRSNPGRDRIGP